MASINYLEIFKHLPKTNCGDCKTPTCLAFAISVVNNEKSIKDCPHLSIISLKELDKIIVKRKQTFKPDELMRTLKKDVANLNFASITENLGAELIDGRLCIKCLGKDFWIDNRGNVESLCHINFWVTIPLLDYVRAGREVKTEGEWVSFERLKKGTAFIQYFNKRCKEPLKQLVDGQREIFFDMVELFRGRNVKGYSSDYSVVIHPLPNVPFLILYWKAEGHFESVLEILFDSGVDSFLMIQSITTLGRGLVEMFTRILFKHYESLPGDLLV